MLLYPAILDVVADESIDPLNAFAAKYGDPVSPLVITVLPAVLTCVSPFQKTICLISEKPLLFDVVFMYNLKYRAVIGFFAAYGKNGRVGIR